MNWIRKNLYLAAIPISMVLSTASMASVEANSAGIFLGKQKAPILISQPFNPKRDVGKPESTTGGASRGGNSNCTQKGGDLVSLLPKDKLGLTLNERPTFYWHMSKSDVKTAEFLLLDDNEDVVYEKNLTLPQKPGIFAFTLPPEAPGLKVDKQYHWFLELNCASGADETVAVEGWVERTRPSLAVRMKLNRAEPKHHSKVYAGAGIWHEAINNVAQQRCANPNDSATTLYWNQLLTSVGLKEVISESLNNVCSN
ncbi:MAG: DUF928 domain-containing protein [Cyanobacteria bacterium P01_D01_bin.116]